MAKKLSPKEQLKALQKVWYKKLEDKGFKDIETPRGELKLTASNAFNRRDKRLTPEQVEAKQEYYRRATHFLNDYDFGVNILEKVIWEYHACGLSVREIALALHNAKVDKSKYVKVHLVIKRLQKEMFKFYSIEDTINKKHDNK